MITKTKFFKNFRYLWDFFFNFRNFMDFFKINSKFLKKKTDFRDFFWLATGIFNNLGWQMATLPFCSLNRDTPMGNPISYKASNKLQSLPRNRVGIFYSRPKNYKTSNSRADFSLFTLFTKIKRILYDISGNKTLVTSCRWI